MLIAGGIALALAVVLLFVARHLNRRDRQMAVAETLSCSELTELQKTAAEAVGEGSFSKVCEVVGAAHPGEGGPLKAPESGKPAVWHRVTVTEHYWDEQRDSDGDRRQVRETREVSDTSSSASFQVKDASGAVFVTPNGAKIDEVPQTFDHFEQKRPTDLGDGVLAGVGEMFANWNDNTIGFQRQEWSLPPGERLYVIGEISDKAGRLEFGKPEDGPYMVSTRSEEELRDSAQFWAKVWAISALVLAVAGVGLAIAGVLTL
jgi:hypothetical protein